MDNSQMAEQASICNSSDQEIGRLVEEYTSRRDAEAVELGNACVLESVEFLHTPTRCLCRAITGDGFEVVGEYVPFNHKAEGTGEREEKAQAIALLELGRAVRYHRHHRDAWQDHDAAHAATGVPAPTLAVDPNAWAEPGTEAPTDYDRTLAEALGGDKVQAEADADVPDQGKAEDAAP